MKPFVFSMMPLCVQEPLPFCLRLGVRVINLTNKPPLIQPLNPLPKVRIAVNVFCFLCQFLIACGTAELHCQCIFTGPVVANCGVKFYDADKLHPTPLGTLLLALCFAKEMFGVSMDQLPSTIKELPAQACDEKMMAHLKSRVDALLK